MSPPAPLSIKRPIATLLIECRAKLARIAELAQNLDENSGSLLDKGITENHCSEFHIRVLALDAVWSTADHAGATGREPLLELLGCELIVGLQKLQAQLIDIQTIEQPLPYIEGSEVSVSASGAKPQREFISKLIFSGRSELAHPPHTGTDWHKAALDDKLADRSLTGLLVPKRDGGLGGTPIDLLPVMESLGESLVITPVLWSTVLATQLLIDASAYPRRSVHLECLLSGNAIAALAHLEDTSKPCTMSLNTVARREAGGWRIDGHKRLAMGADQADLLIVSARIEDGGFALFVITSDSPGLVLHRHHLEDGRGAADLEFSGLLLPSTALLAGPERAAAVLEEAQSLATVALCAEMVGTMRCALVIMLNGQRNSKIANTNIFQHRFVDHYCAWVSTRALVQKAADAWTSAPPSLRQMHISAAKWMSGMVGRAIAMDIFQTCTDLDLQDKATIRQCARRLVGDEQLLGSATQHLSRFVEAGHQQHHDKEISA